MKPILPDETRFPSRRLLLLAIATTILTIITLILTIAWGGWSTSSYLFPMLLTISTLIIAFTTLRRKEIMRLTQKTFHSKYNIISLSLLALMVFLGFLTSYYGYFLRILPLIIIGIGISIVSVLASIFFYNQMADSRRPLPIDTISYPSPLKENFEILRKEIVYEYLADGQTMYQRKQLQLRALKDNVEVYEDRYRWTGSGHCAVRPLSPDFVIVNQRKEGLWNYFDVLFKHPLRKNSIIEFEIEWNLVDSGRTAIPFLATMIDQNTEYLKLQVILPDELAPKRAYSYEFAYYIDTLPIETNEISWDQTTRSLIYEVLHPKKYHKYLIRWYSE